jgi:hypothetical protein
MMWRGKFGTGEMDRYNLAAKYFASGFAFFQRASKDPSTPSGGVEWGVMTPRPQRYEAAAAGAAVRLAGKVWGGWATGNAGVLAGSLEKG